MAWTQGGELTQTGLFMCEPLNVSTRTYDRCLKAISRHNTTFLHKYGQLEVSHRSIALHTAISCVFSTSLSSRPSQSLSIWFGTAVAISTHTHPPPPPARCAIAPRSINRAPSPVSPRMLLLLALAWNSDRTRSGKAKFTAVAVTGQIYENQD